MKRSLVLAAVLILGAAGCSGSTAKKATGGVSIPAGGSLTVSCAGSATARSLISSTVSGSGTSAVLTCTALPVASTTTVPTTTTIAPTTTTTACVPSSTKPCPPSTTHVVPASIAADCSVDVSAQLTAWIASVPDGTAAAPSVLDLASGGCYWVEEGVTVGAVSVEHSGSPLNGRHFLDIEGNGATLKAKNLATPGVRRAQLSIVTGSDITVHNLNAVGVNPVGTYSPSYEHDANIVIDGATDVTLDGVHGSHAYGDFVDTGPQEYVWPDVDIVRNFTLKNSSAVITGRHGVTCDDCDGFTVDHDTFDQIGYHVFDLEVEDATWQATRVAFTNNTIGHVHLSVVSNAGQSHDVANVTISGNTVTALPDTCQEPVFLDWTSTDPIHRPGPYLITGNHFWSYSDVVWINRVDNVTVSGNILTFVNGGCWHSAVEASSSVGDVVTGNNFTGEDTSFTNFDGKSTGFTVSGNTPAP